MRPRDFAITLDPASSSPLFVQISQAFAGDIARGRLRPGDALPGSRTLADTLGVHRSTVVAAYAELVAQGWVDAKRGSATVVATASPEPKPRRFSSKPGDRNNLPRVAGFAVQEPLVKHARLASVPRGAFRLWGGEPDLRLMNVDLLGRAYRRVMRLRGRSLLEYSGHYNGQPDLRRAISDLVSTTRGIAADDNSVFVTRGSQMALDLVARSLLEPGSVVVMEALGYQNAAHVFRRAGANIVPIPVDRYGIDVQAVASLCRDTRVRLVYLTPHHQYPTTVTLAPTRRLALLDLARRERIAIVEDDYDQEFHYDGRPVLPLASNDPAGNVIYVGTLAKSLAPGLRLAFVVAPRRLIERMETERALVDRQGDAVLECAVAELLDDGEVQRHVRRMRRVYHARRDAFCAALDHDLAKVVQYRRPPGGLQVWVNVDPAVNLELWQRRAMDRGVFFHIGREFALDGSPVQSARFGYGLLDETEIPVATRRLVDSLPRRA
jgi:GntR family transcriptional regulator/MocR family aminotransferase